MTSTESASKRHDRLIPVAILGIAAGAALAFFAWVYDAPFVPRESLARWTWTAIGLVVAAGRRPENWAGGSTSGRSSS